MRSFGNVSVWEEFLSTGLMLTNSLLLLTTGLVGVAANVFVVLAVYRQKSLQTSVNALVVNLAVADSLRCVVDCPVLLTVVLTVHHRGRAGNQICEAQTASFSFSCCVQLLTLACISAERYQAIAQPFQSSQRRRRIRILIPLTWTSALLVSALCLLFLEDSPVYVRCRGLDAGKTLLYDTVGFYVLLPLWAVCFAVIIGFYAGIFALVRSHNRKIFDKGLFVPKKSSREEKTIEDATVWGKERPNCEEAQTEKPSPEKLTERKNEELKHTNVTERPHPLSEQSGTGLQPAVLQEPQTALEGAVCMMPSKAGRERARKKKESKMAKRAGYIIVTFLLFWLPLITTILINLLLHQSRNTHAPLIQDLEILSVSVTCVTSLTDPIIYAAVNPQFRSEFYKLRKWVKSRF